MLYDVQSMSVQCGMLNIHITPSEWFVIAWRSFTTHSLNHWNILCLGRRFLWRNVLRLWTSEHLQNDSARFWTVGLLNEFIEIAHVQANLQGSGACQLWNSLARNPFVLTDSLLSSYWVDIPGAEWTKPQETAAMRPVASGALCLHPERS